MHPIRRKPDRKNVAAAGFRNLQHTAIGRPDEITLRLIEQLQPPHLGAGPPHVKLVDFEIALQSAISARMVSSFCSTSPSASSPRNRRVGGLLDRTSVSNAVAALAGSPG
jgi:hypothetical protein